MNVQVTTTQPMMFGGTAISDEYIQEAEKFAKSVHDKNKQNGNKPINPNNHFSCYFSGELENLMGFDIVKHIGGEFPLINEGDIIPIDAVIYGKEKMVEAVMLVGKYNRIDRLYALIMTINDAEHFLSKGKLEAELGGVTFNKLITKGK